jgi:hypothetical protein
MPVVRWSESRQDETGDRSARQWSAAPVLDQNLDGDALDQLRMTETRGRS